MGKGKGTEIVHDIAAKQRHDIISGGGRCVWCGEVLSGIFGRVFAACWMGNVQR